MVARFRLPGQVEGFLSTDELIDLVDDQGEVIGTIWRDEAFTRNIVNIRGVNAFVVNRAGQLWIPRRSLGKQRWPGGYDMGVAGAVSAGETYLSALFREAQEELNLDLNSVPWRQVAYFRPQDTGLSSFQCVYEIELSMSLLTFRASAKSAPSLHSRQDILYSSLAPLCKSKALQGDT